MAYPNEGCWLLRREADGWLAAFGNPHPVWVGDLLYEEKYQTTIPFGVAVLRSCKRKLCVAPHHAVVEGEG